MCKERGKVNAPANLCRVGDGGGGRRCAREGGRGCAGGRWGKGARGDAAGGWTGRRALRGYGGRTETPPAKLSACATCHGAAAVASRHRRCGAAARAGRVGSPHGRWRPSIAPYRNGARRGCGRGKGAARAWSGEMGRGCAGILNTKKHKERRNGMDRSTKARHSDVSHCVRF